MSMRTFLTFIVLVGAVILFSFMDRPAGHRIAVSTAPADRLVGVVNALRTGNAEQLSRYFDSYVDLTLPDKRVISYSRSQAKMVLGAFFDTYRVKSFNMQTRGGGDVDNYCIGTLMTSNGSFRTMLFMKQEGNVPMIKEINLASR